MMRSRASEMLRERFAERGAQANFWRRFNSGLPKHKRVDRPTVSRWVNGKLCPSAEQMARIEDLESGVHMRLWTERSKDVA